jgi:HlyD family secretion protein
MRDLQVQQLEQSIQRMQQNFRIVKENYENLVQRAPISGQLSQLNAEIGELKSPGERLGQIDVLDGYKVRAAIDEYYINRIAQGQTAEAELAGEKVALLVRRVFPEVREGRFEIDLEFTAAAPRGIRRGQSIQLRLALGELTEAVMIARGGFYQATGGNWIYVLDESGDFARKRRIRLGRQNPRMYEVLEGLEVGEKVITSSYDNYGDFEKLNLN